MVATQCSQASQVAQIMKNLPKMQESWVQSLGWEDSLETGMATHSRILAWRIPWTEKPDRLQSMGSQRVGHDWATNTHRVFAHKGLIKSARKQSHNGMPATVENMKEKNNKETLHVLMWTDFQDIQLEPMKLMSQI